SITVNNFAAPAFEETSGGGTFGHNGTSYTLDLGTLQKNSGPVTIDLGVLNDVAGPADLLAGSFDISGSGAFGNSGFAAFSGLGAGAADTAPTVTLDTGTAGVFTETITLHGTGSNASGYSGALADRTLTITANVGNTAPVATNDSYTT